MTSQRQRGITLIVTLVMLIMLTLFALAAIRLANVNLRITGNYQWQKEMEVLTDSAIEQFASNSTNFYAAPVDQDICQNGQVVTAGTCTALINPKIGTLKAAHCIASSVATGYTLKLGELAPDDNRWEITATTQDGWSGAKVTITRGFSVLQPAGNCPA